MEMKKERLKDGKRRVGKKKGRKEKKNGKGNGRREERTVDREGRGSPIHISGYNTAISTICSGITCC